MVLGFAFVLLINWEGNNIICKYTVQRVPYGHEETIQITKISKVGRTARPPWPLTWFGISFRCLWKWQIPGWLGAWGQEGSGHFTGFIFVSGLRNCLLVRCMWFWGGFWVSQSILSFWNILIFVQAVLTFQHAVHDNIITGLPKANAYRLAVPI